MVPGVMSIVKILLILSFSLLSTGCNRKPPKFVHNQELFHEPVIKGHVENDGIIEISGVAHSRRHKDILYVLNDSGWGPSFYALNSTNAQVVGKLNINGAMNCDWEDIAVGTGPYGQTYIYIGDIGGNTKSTCNTIYRIVEPLSIQEETTMEIHGELQFRWDAPNCETLLIDEMGMLYLVSKVYSGIPKLYKIPNTAWKFSKVTLGKGTNVSIPVHSVTNQAVGGDISKTGKEILIKTYGSIFYWKRSLETEISEVLQKRPRSLPYMAEPQGEAICWGDNDNGFYTISEGPNQPIFYYRRKELQL